MRFFSKCLNFFNLKSNNFKDIEIQNFTVFSDFIYRHILINFVQKSVTIIFLRTLTLMHFDPELQKGGRLYFWCFFVGQDSPVWDWNRSVTCRGVFKGGAGSVKLWFSWGFWVTTGIEPTLRRKKLTPHASHGQIPKYAPGWRHEIKIIIVSLETWERRREEGREGWNWRIWWVWNGWAAARIYPTWRRSDQTTSTVWISNPALYTGGLPGNCSNKK